MNIAVCEDNEAHRERLKNMIAEWAGRTGRRTQTACFASAEAFEMAEIPAGGYDLIFLDIQMKQMDGMKLAEKIREQDDRVLLVFTTSYEDYAIAGYDVGAFAYLLKPLAPDKVFQTLSKAAGTMKRNPSDARILHSEGENIRIYPSEIRYIEVQGHTLSFHMREEIIHCRARLADIERNLPRPPFSRSHRSYLVNLAYVDKIGKEGLRIGRNLIPVSRNCWEALNRDYLEFYRNR